MPVKKSVKKVPNRRATKGRVSAEPKMVSFGTAVCNFFRKFFQFSGVATRAEYWWVMLFLCIVFCGLPVILGEISLFLNFVNMNFDALFVALLVMSGLLVIISVAFLIPIFALTARRLHDAGFSAKILWICVGLWVFDILAHFFGFEDSVVFISLYWGISFGLGIFTFVVSLLPSKVRGNPYRD